MRIDRSNLTSAARRAAALAATTAIALACAASAEAYQAAPGWTATDYATGFPWAEGDAGPIGLAFDANANLFVSDVHSGTLHRVPPGGATADATKLRGDYGQPTGLAFGKDGRLYMARIKQQDVVEVNPSNGEIVRTVASGLPCPVGLATDPISGDLFVSNVFCDGGGIRRISGFSNGVGTSTRYAGNQDADGLTFAPDGTLYASGGSKVLRVEGTSSSSPGTVSEVAAVPTVDGLVYSPATALDVAYLVLVRNDGEIDRLDFDGRLTAIVTGGSRGDLVTVGPDRCIYADLQDRVIKIGPSAGQCGFAGPVGPGAPPPAPGQGVLGEQQAKRLVDTAIKASAAKTMKRGKRLRVTLNVRNLSTSSSHALTVTNIIPKGTKFVRARTVRSVACKAHRRTVTCRKSSLANGKSFTVKILVRAVRGKRYVNTARVKSNDLDPVPGNNKSRSVTKVK